jgi:integrase
MTETQEESPNISLSGESWARFERNLEGKSKNTSEVYTRYIKEILKNFNKTPDQFCSWIKDTYASGDELRIDDLVYEFHKFYRELITGEEEFHISSIRLYEASVNFFCKSNRIPKIPRYSPNGDIKKELQDQFIQNGKDKATKEEIRELLKHSPNPRTRSFILLTYETGLRASDVANLKIEDISPVLENPDLEFYSWEMIPIKNWKSDNPMKANPTIGRDAIRELRTWIKYREEILKIPVSPESPVYCTVTDKGSGKGLQVQPDNLSRNLYYVREKAGIDKPISMHSLRKSNTTYLTSSGINEKWRNLFQGKKGKGSEIQYQKPDLLEVYKKAYPQFSIYGLEQSEKVQSLEEKVEDQNKIIEELQRQLNVVLNMEIPAGKVKIPTKDLTTEENLNVERKYTEQQREKTQPENIDPIEAIMSNKELKAEILRKLLSEVEG